MQDFYFDNKATKIYCTAWEDVTDPKGVVVAVHDAGDHGKRWQDFAAFLNANGYYVVAPDLRGHGRTAGGYDKRGEVEGDSFFDSVDDLHRLTSYALATYRLPLVMVGMGYGGMLAVAYIQQYGDTLSGLVLLSPTATGGFSALLGNIATSTTIGFIDAKNPATLLNRYRYKRYEQPFLAEKNRFAWISRDKEEVRAYVNDAYCGAQFAFSLGFEQARCRGLLKIGMSNRMRKVPDDLPILLLVGDDDPVCMYGLAVDKLHKSLLRAGNNRSYLKTYRHARHDLLHETNRDQVFVDVLTFIGQSIG